MVVPTRALRNQGKHFYANKNKYHCVSTQEHALSKYDERALKKDASGVNAMNADGLFSERGNICSTRTRAERFWFFCRTKRTKK